MSTIAELEASNTALVAKIVETDTKVDALIAGLASTKAALISLQNAATPPAQIQAIVDAQTAAASTLTATEAKIDAAIAP